MRCVLLPAWSYGLRKSRHGVHSRDWIRYRLRQTFRNFHDSSWWSRNRIAWLLHTENADRTESFRFAALPVLFRRVRKWKPGRCVSVFPVPGCGQLQAYAMYRVHPPRRYIPVRRTILLRGFVPPGCISRRVVLAGWCGSVNLSRSYLRSAGWLYVSVSYRAPIHQSTSVRSGLYWKKMNGAGCRVLRNLSEEETRRGMNHPVR